MRHGVQTYVKVYVVNKTSGRVIASAYVDLLILKNCYAVLFMVLVTDLVKLHLSIHLIVARIQIFKTMHTAVGLFFS